MPSAPNGRSAQAVDHSVVVEKRQHCPQGFAFDPDYPNSYLNESNNDVVVYAPNVPVFKGLFIADGTGAKRYRPGHACDVWQFLSIQFEWDWQARVTPDNPDYLPTLLRGIGQALGHPEVENLPIVVTPRQGAWKNIGKYLVETVPHQTIAIGYGFGDERYLATTSAAGIPCTTAFEIKGKEDNTWQYFKSDFTDGQMITVAGEHGFSMHWMNGKASFGYMMLHQAIKARLPPTADARLGPVALRPMPYADGVIGALDPVWEGSGWRELTPVPTFSGDRTRHIWRANQEHAEAWRGYMNHHPLVMITTPTSAFGLLNEYLGNSAPLDAGMIEISVDRLVRPTAQHKARKLVEPTQEELDQIARVHLVQGERHLGTIEGYSGSILAEFAPGIHLITPIVELHDGRRDAAWPAGFLVGGNMYPLSGRTITFSINGARPTLIPEGLLGRPTSADYEFQGLDRNRNHTFVFSTPAGAG